MKLLDFSTLLFCVLACSITSLGQAPVTCTSGADIPSCFSDPNRQATNADLRKAIGITNPGTDDFIIHELVKRRARLMAESASQSIQNGGSTLSSAATSLVSNSLSSILGIAEESGAVSSTTSGSATTLTANLQQITYLLSPDFKACYLVSPNCSFGSQLLHGGTLAVSLNSSAQTNTPSLNTTSSAALAALSGINNPLFNSLVFKENFHGRRREAIEPDSFRTAVTNIDGTIKTEVLDAYQAIVTPLIGKGDLANPYTVALNGCYSTLRAAQGSPAAVKTCRESLAGVVAKIPNIDSMIETYVQAEVAYSDARDAALKSVFYDSTYSVEYDLTNNANQPMTSTFKGIYGYQHQFKHSVLETTANGSVTIYNSLHGSSESHFRSAQGALQFDLKPDSQRMIQPEFSAGYYFQYMVSNGLLTLPSTAFAPGTTIPLPSNASELLNTTGPIHIGQGKLTLSIKGTNIKIPLAVTGASRTDLVKANKVSGNFGISYDFSSLFSKQ